ncbi:MAG: Fur family transcriptional regulator [Acidimicrobiales bacterium]
MQASRFGAAMKSEDLVSGQSGDEEEEVLSRLRLAGDRVTTSRRLLVRSLFEASGHRTAEQLAVEIQTHAPDVSISTVYRNLEELERLGVVVHSHLGHGPATYHLATEAHGHLVCRNCEAQVEIADAFFADLRRRAVAEFGFAIDPRHFAVIGLCAKCQADAGAGGDLSAG